MGRESDETWDGFDSGRWYAKGAERPSEEKLPRRKPMPTKDSLLKALGIGEDGRTLPVPQPSALPSSLQQNRPQPERRLKSLWLLGGSSLGNDPALWGEATQLADVLARRHIKLYYNGATDGMLGMVAEQFFRSGGEAVVVTAKDIKEKPGKHVQILVAEKASQRRELMLRRPDCYLALPGGVGTFRDLLEVWLWGQMGLHKKPCGILNSANFYDGFRVLTDRMVAEGFLTEGRRDRLLIDNNAADLMDLLEDYCPVKAGHDDSASMQHSVG